MNEFGQRLRARRLELGMTAEELAEKIGKHRATVCRYETGEIVEVSAQTVETLAAALQCTPAWLLGWQKKCLGLVAQNRGGYSKRRFKHRASITRIAEIVKELCARKEMSYDEMVEAVRPLYLGFDKSALSKAANTGKYGVALTRRAAEAILDAAERKKNDNSRSSGHPKDGAVRHHPSGGRRT